MTTLGRAALLGIAGFVLGLAALHWLEPGLDASTEAVSYYVHGRFGWVLTGALLALGAGSGAIVLGLLRAWDGPTLGVLLLGVWTVGVVLGAVFPADPRGRWSEPPSIAGAIHGHAAIAAFVALPIAAHLIARRLRARAGWREAGLLTGLAACTAGGLLLFAAALAPVFVRPGPPILLGLAERLLLASYAAWLAAAALGLIRSSPRLTGG